VDQRRRVRHRAHQFVPPGEPRASAVTWLTIVGVDGEYGFNSYELASYVVGDHRGAWDYARDIRVEPHLPDDAICFLNWVGPAWFVLPRQLLLTPILKVIATKARTADAIAALRSQYERSRRDDILAQIDRSYPAE
jgi:hypothetical protein